MPPGRRPRVAGLRKPGETPSPTPRPADDTADDTAEMEQDPPATTEHAPVDAAPVDADVDDDATDTAATDTAATDTAVPDAAASDTDATEADATEADATEADPDVGETDTAAARSPRAKPRSAGTGKPEVSDDVPETHAPGTPPKRLIAARGVGRTKSGLSRRGSYILAAVLVVLAGVFSTGAVLAKQQYSEVSRAVDNAALLDVAKTQQVKKAMKQAVEKLFSYDYRNIAKTEKAAKQLLASKEVQRTYTTLMGEVKRLAPKQKIVVTVNATEAAVVELHEDSAKVMVYADQTATRTKTGESSGGGTALWLRTELRDGKWKIVAMDTYSSGAPVNSGGKNTGKQDSGTSSGSAPSSGAQPSGAQQGGSQQKDSQQKQQDKPQGN